MIYRIRGLGLINDPNDFGQLLVCVTPLLFFFWRAKKLVFNIVLRRLAGVRAADRRLPYALARGTAGPDGHGGRGGAAAHRHAFPRWYWQSRSSLEPWRCTSPAGEISRPNRARTARRCGVKGWKSSRPIPCSEWASETWGTTPRTHQTAHNSVVVCAAELGLFGLYFWSLCSCCQP
jgi:hypothetical protein